jgi:hypothetical protein
VQSLSHNSEHRSRLIWTSLSGVAATASTYDVSYVVSVMVSDLKLMSTGVMKSVIPPISSVFLSSTTKGHFSGLLLRDMIDTYLDTYLDYYRQTYANFTVQMSVIFPTFSATMPDIAPISQKFLSLKAR